MTWLNPLAFLGLLALVVPVLVHLFGRPRARRQPFPAVRFIQPARQAPIRWSQPSDWLLLALRAAVVLVAVVALARPSVPGTGSAAAGRTTRVVVLDTSRSMDRLTSDGRPVREAARQRADSLITSADDALLVETARPGDEVAGSGSWLARRAGHREIVVISDFQAGAMTAADIRDLPDGTGLGLARVPFSSAVDTVSVDARAGSVTLTTRVAMEERTTAVRWSLERSPAIAADSTVIILAGEEERDAAVAAFEAARSRSVVFPGRPPDRRLAIVWPSYPGRAALLDSARRPTVEWQGRVLLRLHADPLLAAAAGSTSDSAAVDAERLAVVARNEAGEPVALAAESSLDGEPILALFSMVHAGSVTSAALIAAAFASLDEPAEWSESEPAVLPDETLRGWERPSRDAGPSGEEGNPARWLWLLALALLGVETWLRRGSPSRSTAPEETEMPRERVA